MHPRLHNLLLTTTALLALGTAPTVAGPDGPHVVGGGATVTGAGTGNVIVNQTTQNAIINWNTFNIGVGQSTTFFQPNSSSIALNRVTGGLGPSEILGTLTANGRVFVINRDGVLFGPGAVVNTAGFLASTNDIRNSDFMAGRMNFTIPGRPDASIVNQGTITAASGGFAALVAPGVRNSGTISATLGTVSLAAGNSFTLDFYGDKLITLAVGDQIAGKVVDVATGQPLTSLVTNTGKIRANGGRVELTAATARAVVDSVINTSGVIKANSVGLRNGMIVLGGATGSSKGAGAPTQTVKVSGTVSAAGKKKGTKGGTIVVTGEDIQIVNAAISAWGVAGGGKVMIGGDWGGGRPDTSLVSNQSAKLEGYALATATTVSVDAASTINASAKDRGDGGKVILWSDAQTTFAGTILVRGGANGGNGGFVETSSHGTLGIVGIADTGAPKGSAGTWLLDPANITIDLAMAGAIATGLTTGNVTVATGTSGAGNGDILVNSAITWSNSNALTLSAFRNIEVNANITNTSGGGAVNLRADSTGFGTGTVSFGAATVSTSGAVSVFYNPISYTEAGTKSDNIGNPFSSFVVGGGTLTAYMLVNSAANLQDIGTNLQGNFALGRDISAGAFTPLGTFGGLLDGQNHTISGVNVAATGNSQTIGGFAATNTGTIRNVAIAGTVNGGAFQDVVAGGLVGINQGTITDSHAAVNVKTGDSPYFTSTAVAGGLAAVNSGTITTSSASGNVSGSGNTIIGGLVGWNQASISTSYATGAVLTQSFSLYNVGITGGLVGRNSGSITSSYATGTVSNAGMMSIVYIGGLVGQMQGSASIDTSYASGNVSVDNTPGIASDGSRAGGLVGDMENSSSISNSYALGNVTVSSGTYGYSLAAGGLIGWHFSGSATNTYSTGAVSLGAGNQTLNTALGGFIGIREGGSVSYGYWDRDTSGQTIGIGNDITGPSAGIPSGLLTANVRNTPADYSGFDFATTWFMLNGLTRPFLRAEYSSTINNSHQLQLMLLNLGTGYTLARNIDLGPDLASVSGLYPGMWGAAGFVPLGDNSSFSNTTRFTGPLDGQNHSIQNLSINSAASLVGLFGYIGSTGAVRNLTLENVTVTGNAPSGPQTLGILAGQNDGSIVNVSTLGTNSVTATTHTATTAGGLVGLNTGTIAGNLPGGNDVNIAVNIGSGGNPNSAPGTWNYAGGVAGINTGTITDMRAAGAVTAGNFSFAGGLVGQNGNTGMPGGLNALVHNSRASGTVTGDHTVGGLVGANFVSGGATATINVSSATGNVILHTGGFAAGGLVGQNQALVDLSSYTGTVSGSGIGNENPSFTRFAQLGGLVGLNANGGIVRDSSANATIGGSFVVAGGLVGSNFATVTGTSLGQVFATAAVTVDGAHSTGGGLVGTNSNGGTILNANATGTVAAANPVILSKIGGLVGQNDGSIDHSTANVTVTGGVGSAGGLVGQNSGPVTFSSASGNLSGAGTAGGGTASLGGLVGTNLGNGQISNSSASVTVNGGNYSTVGGLVGLADGGSSITNSWANSPITVTVNGGTPFLAGGLVGGTIAGAVITDSQALGDVTVLGTASSGGNAGGLVGQNFGAIVGTSTLSSSASCAAGASFTCAKGSVSVPAGPGSNVTSNAGGLVGFNQGTGQNPGQDGTIFNAFATGNVVAASGSGDLFNRTSNLGGLVGTNQGKIVNSHATGNVGGASLNGGIGAGGLVADNSGEISNSYATGNVATGAGGQAGGFVANNSSGGDGGGRNNSQLITGSFATGNVSVGGSTSLAGGFAGSNEGTISNSQYVAALPGINISNTGGNAMLGGFVGANVGGNITSSSSNANVTGTGLGLANLGGFGSAPSAAGGFVGLNTAIITNSSATGNVSVSGSNIGDFTGGGFAGLNQGTIQGTPGNSTFTYATGNVTGSSNSIVGGFVGGNFGTINFAYATGQVEVNSDAVAGGFFGVNYGTITQAYATGKVFEDANSVLGGFGAINVGNLSEVFSTGQVIGGVNSIVGGLVAVNAAVLPLVGPAFVGTITNAYSISPVSGGAGSIVAGLVAVNDGGIDMAYSAGTVSGGAGSILGGLVARNNPDFQLPHNFFNDGGTPLPLRPGSGTVTNSYWDTQTSGQSASAGGTGQTTHEMLAGLPTNWSPSTWTILPDPSYPYFVWQPVTTIPNQVDPGSNVVVDFAPQPKIIANLTDTTALTPPVIPVALNSAQGGVRLPVFPPSTLPPGMLARIIDIPPLALTAFVANEVVLQIRCDAGTPQLETAVRAIGLTLAESQNLCNTTGTSAHRFRFEAGRTIQDVIRALAAVQIVAVAQPNYRYALQQDTQPAAASGGQVPDAAQYVVEKLRLADVHRAVRGTNITVAVIDSEIDANHPDLAGVIAQRFSAVGAPEKPHAHGTGMAGAIASHQKLIGVAPGARLLAVHAFSTSAASAESTTFQILKGIDWATTQGARIINMSFAGPRDRSLERALKVAYDKNIVLIAAAGNAGPSSPPLYPGADPNVIAVTATDINDKLFPGANRGRYIAISAPGVDVIVPAPEGNYQLTTGTSVAAAEISGVVALMLERNPALRPADIRRILANSAKRLAPGPRDDGFGWGLVDPLAAIRAADPRTVQR